ncbi:hypothetical protein C8J57DRAFT_1238904 [Mycena rebaudengoi]|nr:hypothetical protein C8J57DRAFT_1238904 [Mycena rebaudengoi]
MPSSTSRSKVGILTEYQVQPAHCVARQEKLMARNEKARIRMAQGHRRRREIKTLSEEEQKSHAERARAAQAKYRAKNRERLAIDQALRRQAQHSTIYGPKTMKAWNKKLAIYRQRREDHQAQKERELRRKARWAARVASPLLSHPEPDPLGSDSSDSDNFAASPAASE